MDSRLWNLEVTKVKLGSRFPAYGMEKFGLAAEMESLTVNLPANGTEIVHPKTFPCERNGARLRVDEIEGPHDALNKPTSIPLTHEIGAAKWVRLHSICQITSTNVPWTPQNTLLTVQKPIPMAILANFNLGRFSSI